MNSPWDLRWLLVARASLAGYLSFKDTPEVKEWLSEPFFKVVCEANSKEI